MRKFFASLFAFGSIGGALPPAVLWADPPSTTTVTTRTIDSIPGVWITVPEDYDGDYYYYNEYYYHGGTCEFGDFAWEGQRYRCRYRHDGKWIYGGKWEHHCRR